MNKYQQALNFLYNTIKDNLISFDDTEKEAVEILQELVDKATPTKPSYWGDGYDYEGNIIYDMYDCPKCGESYEIDYEKYKYCPNCGQAIDWSDKEWKN
ncbi:hypothetical protein [uncultured Thomasclavelia sp.]|uniref:hypothetical protein n=1 Tax=uncultured Thomasclavelia sp. TaxID=3025759 RepID=UPI0026340FE6|nr:hypothetical protein [uncultured Thomasclavelia sp.]